MTYFKISAPGRIVLSGEHAAIYGKVVVMASLDRRTTLKFCELIDDQLTIIKIEFPDVNLSLNVSLEEVLKLISSDFNRIISNHNRLFNLVQLLITSNGMWCTYEQRFSLQTFFFLLFYIAAHENLKIKPFHVHVSTELPIGAGLGSSSSFAVCLSACFLHWAHLQKGAHNAFNVQELSMISIYAMYCEQVVQKNVYGADSDVCSFGKIVRSQYNNLQDHYNNRFIDVQKMRILLIDLNNRQNKGERAKQMADLKHSRPEFVDFILSICNEISRGICITFDAIFIIQRNRNLLQLQNKLYAELQRFIWMNQFTLFHSGFGGGFVYILVPSSIPEDLITDYSTHLMALGFNVTMTNMSCSGVTIDD